MFRYEVHGYKAFHEKSIKCLVCPIFRSVSAMETSARLGGLTARRLFDQQRYASPTTATAVSPRRTPNYLAQKMAGLVAADSLPSVLFFFPFPRSDYVPWEASAHLLASNPRVYVKSHGFMINSITLHSTVAIIARTSSF